MNRVGLRSRLFLSHLVVMMVGLLSFLVISRAAAHHLFAGHLDYLEEIGVTLIVTRKALTDGFEAVWSKSTLLAMLVGTVTSASLSYWVAKRIMRPIARMERVTRQFAAGHLHERVDASEIPELAQLGNSFNRLASSLENVETRRRELIGDLTHELRTPLTIVRGYLEQAINQQSQPSLEICELLVKETRRLERLVNDMQELSKAEAGHLSLNLRPVELYPLLKFQVERFSSQLMDDTELKLMIPAHLPLVFADSDRIEQILVNLIGNAIRHTAQGQITLRAWLGLHHVWIAVEDTGSGIATADLPYVFDRFWRSAASRSSKGTGIGLAITKRLVELQGGIIEVESQLECGSIFRFSLPIV